MDKVKELREVINKKDKEIDDIKQKIKDELLETSEWKIGDILFSYTDNSSYDSGTRIIVDVDYDFNKDVLLYIHCGLDSHLSIHYSDIVTYKEICNEKGYNKIGECKFNKDGYITEINLRHTFEERFDIDEGLCDVDENSHCCYLNDRRRYH